MSYLRLRPGVSLRRLEEPYLYDARTDELYELSDEAWDYLLAADGSRPGYADLADAEFLADLLAEDLVELSSEVRPLPARVGSQDATEVPSLRYLELYLTERCNLRCRHCFLGELSGTDLPLATVAALLDGFDAMGGLRLLLTGGEALLHPGFWELNDRFRAYGFRTVLLTNGLALEEAAPRLRVHEVQVSLDGLRAAHDALRGDGSYDRALSGQAAAREAGLDVSVATTVNRLNRDDLPGLEGVVREAGARSWQVDAPSPCGTLLAHPELLLPPGDAGPLLDFAFGGAVHGSVPGAVCGAHLMAVFANGRAAKCGFYAAQPVGRAEEGLIALWRRVPRPPLAGLACDCPFLEQCHGGCRFRAASYYNEDGRRDPVQCARYGVTSVCDEGGGA